MTWGKALIRDVATFVMGQAPPGTEVNEIGLGTPFFRSGEFEDIRPKIAAWTTKPLRLALSTDVFVCVVGANAGEVNRGADGAIGRSIGAVRSGDSLDHDYLYYFLRSIEVYLRNAAQGSAQAVISKDDLGRIEIPLPVLKEQRAIAGVLEALDDKIESNRRVVKKSELLLLAHSNSLSYLPTVALSEVSKSYRRPVNPLVLGDGWVDHFSLPAFDAAAMPERCQASSIMSGKFGIETTSVLISRLNPGTPRVWCAHVREVPAMCSPEFLVIEPLHESSVGALWLAAVHPTLGEQMVQRATGTSFSHQRIKSDDALSVEVPDIRMIDDQVRTECDELIEMVGKRRSENEHLSRLRDVLLPELLSGRLRVKDAESMMENV
jgi:type I restriction enzyme S subunit